MRRTRVLGPTLLVLLILGTAPWHLLGARPAVLAGQSGRAPAAPADTRGYQSPLAGTATVTRPFEPPPQPWLAGHRGVDLAGTPGEAVLAAGPGTVVFAGTIAGVGVVSIGHADGLRTTYQPVDPLVGTGATVLAGQRIGTLVPGHPGCPLAACLHWGLRRGADYLDPLGLLRVTRVRLYPVDP